MSGQVNKMSFHEALSKARELITPPENWTQNSHAVTREGDCVSAYDLRACSFCMIGAVLRVTDDSNHFYRFLFEGEKVSGEKVGAYNDNHTHVEVLEFMDRLIAAARIEELK